MTGFIHLHRKLIEWEWFSDAKTFHVFMFLLLDANHTHKKWRGVDVKRGQTLTGRIKISEATGVSQQSVRTALSNLKSTKEITIQSTNKFSIVTVCNYDKYQGDKTSTNQQTNQPTNQQPTTNKKETKIIPKDLSPQSVKVWADAKGWEVTDDIFESFCDYHVSKGSSYKNWNMALQTWVRNHYTRFGGASIEKTKANTDAYGREAHC